MRDEYDFSLGKRGAVDHTCANKVRITIRLDPDIINWFKEQVHALGGGNYQTLINSALRKYIESTQEPFEETIRRVIRTELQSEFLRHRETNTWGTIENP
jgi:metal-responsive CopG/Arc/MetJ family transcriptional regulator